MAKNKSLAEKMFKKLGYKKKTYQDKVIIYTREKQDYGQTIINFYLNEKDYSHFIDIDDSSDLLYIDMELHKAIHEQLKELGWLDE